MIFLRKITFLYWNQIFTLSEENVSDKFKWKYWKIKHTKILLKFKKIYKNGNNIKILIKTEKQYFSYIKITLLRGVAMRLLGYIKSVFTCFMFLLVKMVHLITQLIKSPQQVSWFEEIPLINDTNKVHVYFAPCTLKNKGTSRCLRRTFLCRWFHKEPLTSEEAFCFTKGALWWKKVIQIIRKQEMVFYGIAKNNLLKHLYF